MKPLIYFLILSLGFTQRLDDFDINLRNLNSVLETASRSSQRVFVEDFTGLL